MITPRNPGKSTRGFPDSAGATSGFYKVNSQPPPVSVAHRWRDRAGLRDQTLQFRNAGAAIGGRPSCTPISAADPAPAAMASQIVVWRPRSRRQTIGPALANPSIDLPDSNIRR